VALIFTFGIALMLAAPLLRRHRKASHSLVAGAFIALAVAAFGLLFPNIAAGQEAIESDRRFYLAILAFELPGARARINFIPIFHVRLLAGMDNKFNCHAVAHCIDGMAEILLALVSSKWLEMTCIRSVL
jgi:hypothetical protein